MPPRFGSQSWLALSLLAVFVGVAIGEALDRMSAPEIEDALQVSDPLTNVRSLF